MLPTVRAQPTTFSPCWTSARATAAPMPPEAPVTKASRSRHRSMPALAVVPSRPHTSLREPDIWIAELRPGSQGLGSSSLTAAAAVAADLALSEPRLNPPPFCRAPGWGSTLRSPATRRHIQPLDCRGLAAPPLPAPPQAWREVGNHASRGAGPRCSVLGACASASQRGRETEV